MTSLSRFLGIGLGSSPERREELTASQALTITPVTGTHAATQQAHTVTSILTVTQPYSHSHSARHCCT